VSTLFAHNPAAAARRPCCCARLGAAPWRTRIVDIISGARDNLTLTCTGQYTRLGSTQGCVLPSEL